MTNMGAKFEQKKKQSAAKIKKLLWEQHDGGNDDVIIEIANKSGIAPETVEQWQSEVDETREAKSRVEGSDIDQLKETAKRKKTAFRTADTKAAKAIEIREEHARESDQAQQELRDANRALRELTTDLYRIDAPDPMIPEQCKMIHKYNEASTRRDKVRRDARGKRRLADKLERSVEYIESHIDEKNMAAGPDAVGLTEGSDMLPVEEINKRKLRGEKKKLKSAQESADKAEEDLKPLEEDVQRARQAAGI